VILSVVRVSQKARSRVLSYLFLIDSHECHEGELSFSHGFIVLISWVDGVSGYGAGLWSR